MVNAIVATTVILPLMFNATEPARASDAGAIIGAIAGGLALGALAASQPRYYPVYYHHRHHRPHTRIVTRTRYVFVHHTNHYQGGGRAWGD